MLFTGGAVRSYKEQKVDRATVGVLIDAAIQAPSAMNAQPWAFAVIQDAGILAQYSDRAKRHLLQTAEPGSPLYDYRGMLSDPGYNIYYDAGTLILICARRGALNSPEDCCLAAQNLMLAACSLGFGTCVIGFARPWLSLVETKQELGIPEDYEPVLPIIVGYSKGEPSATSRHKPEILFWK